MNPLVTLRVQVGIDETFCFSETVPVNTSVGRLREIIRERQKVRKADGIVLVSNGKCLRYPKSTLRDLGLCNDSKILCIISKRTGRKIEEFIEDEEDEKYNNAEPVLEVEFDSRPFGFSVWANEKGESAIVTKVGDEALSKGLRMGFAVYMIADKNVLKEKHEDIVAKLKNNPCPIRVVFIDLGKDYTVNFRKGPLGFTVAQNKAKNYARVAKIRGTGNKNIKVGSYIAAINGHYLMGQSHMNIVDTINNTVFPMVITFRDLPELLQTTKSSEKE